VFLAVCLTFLQCVPPAFAAQFTVFRTTYVRDADAPETVTDQFTVLNSQTTWTLRAINGDLEDTSAEKVSSSTAKLNGTDVLQPHQFNQTVNIIEVPVTLQAANTLATQVRSKPGGRLTIELLGQDDLAPTIAITQPATTTIVSVPQVPVTVTASDDVSGLQLASFRVTANGTDWTGAFPAFTPTLTVTRSATLTLTEGVQTLRAGISDLAGNSAAPAEVTVLVDLTPPALTIVRPADGASLDSSSVDALLSYDDAVSGVDSSTLVVRLDGQDVTGQFTVGPDAAQGILSVADGSHDLTATIFDRAGHQATRLHRFMVETGPAVTPQSGFIHGTVFHAHTETPLPDATITVRGVEGHVRSGPDGRFQFPTPSAGQFVVNIEKPGFTAVQRNVEVLATRDVAVETAFLTPLDPVVTLITPAAGGVATDSSGDFIVTFPPGAAPRDLPVRITPLTDERQLPGPLQEEEGHIAAVYFEPRFTAFNAPATLRVRNTLGLPPGTTVNLQLWAEDAQAWGDVEPGRVTADGWIEFRIIRFFCWYCIWLRRRLPSGSANPNPQQTTSTTAQAQDPGKGCNVSAQSEVCLSTGGLSESHTLPAIRTLGTSRALTFTYRSSSASPSALLGTDYVLDPADPSGPTAIPATTSVTIQIEGRLIQAAFSGASGPLRQGFLWDGRNARDQLLPTGAYPYTVTISNDYNATLGDTGLPALGRSTLATTVRSRAILMNERASPFAAGWALQGLQRLLPQPDGTVLSTDGDGSATVFHPGPSPDLAVVSFSGNDVSVLSGHGDGTFQPSQRFPMTPDPPVVNTLPFWAAAGDFNEDELQDLAVALNRSNDVALLLGVGRTVFSAPVRVAAGGAPAFIAATYVNGDRHTDLLVVNQQSNDVSVLLGNGDGTFQSLPRIAVGQTPTRAAVGDVSGDGIQDLVTANQGASDLSVLLGNGNGTFQPERRLPVEPNPLSVAIDDFNRDGRADLAVAYGGFRNVSRLLGNGDGTFQPQTTIPSGSHSFSDIAAGDVDGDANADLVVTTNRAAVIVLRGIGDGTFRPPQELVVAGPSFAAILSDLNQDGLNDIAATTTTGAVSLLLSNGDGTFQRQRRFPVGFDAVAILAGEFDDRAGDPDQVFSGLPGDFSQLRRHPDGTFERLLTNGTRLLFDARGFHTATLDRNEDATRYLYDAQDRLRRVEFPGGAAFDLAYTPADGHLASVTDSAGRTTQVVVDGTGDLQRITYPDGATRQFTYDAEHRLTAQTNERGFITEYGYDAFGRVQEAVLPERPIFGTASLQREVRRFTPSETQGLINALPAGVGTPDNPAPAVPTPSASFQDASGNRTQVLTDHFGAPTQLIDPLGRTTVIERDVNGLPVRVTSPTGAQAFFLYDSRGNLTLSTQRTVPLPNLPLQVIINRFEYEPAFNQVTKIIDPRRDSPFDPLQNACPAGCTTTIEYEGRGNPVRMADHLGNATAFTYDDRGLLVTVTDALGTAPAIPDDHQTRFTYDAITGNLLTTIDPENRTTALTYDAAGNVETSRDAAMRIATFTYDPLNRLRSVRDPLNQTTAYTYDAAGNLTRVTDANTQSTTFTYDSLNLLSSTTNPLNETKQFFYDRTRNLAEVQDAKQQTITFTYDAASQLTGKVLRDALGSVQDIVTYQYDSLGDLTRVQDTDSKLTFTYDSIGRLLTASTGEAGNPAFAQPVKTLSYTYDLNGNRRSLGAPDGADLEYAYDSLNRLLIANSRTFADKALEYDALDRVTRLSGGPVSTFSYDAASQLTSLTTTLLGTPLEAFAYTYDPLGNRTSLTDRLGLHQYGYDALSRLTSADHPLASGLPDELFTYDPVGNRRTSHLSAAHLHNAANRLLEDDAFTYTYDANGNRTSKTAKATGAVTTYTYDVENQLIRIELPDGPVATYRYDGLGRRIEKAVAGTVTRFLYDQEDLLATYDATGCWHTTLFHGPGIDAPYALLTDGSGDCTPNDAVGFREQIRYLQADGLGSITSLVSETSGFFRALNLKERYTYDAFGTPRLTGPGPDGLMDTGDDVVLPESAFGNPYLFTGREWDAESGLYYYRRRYYDPRTGRFLQEDPRAGTLHQPNTQHSYVYVENNPIRFTDPTGELSVAGAATAFAVAIGLVVLFMTLAFESMRPLTERAKEDRMRQDNATAFDVAEIQAEMHERRAKSTGAIEAVTTIGGICALGGDPEASAISLGAAAATELITAVHEKEIPK